jgi:hypothetical protein
LPFGTKIAKTQHFSDQKREVAKSGSRRKTIRFGVGLAVSGKHTEDPSKDSHNDAMFVRLLIDIKDFRWNKSSLVAAFYV